MKDTFYFSHDYTSRTDPKIKRLISKHGIAGYGIFWAIVEELYINANALPLEYDTFAYDLHTDEKTIKSVINDFELFIIKDKMFGSLSIEKRLEIRSEKSANARKSALIRWGKYANALQSECDSNAIKEKKENEIKQKETKLEIAYPFNFSDKRILIFKNWFEYKKEIKDFYKSQKSIDALFKKFEKFTDFEIEKIVQNSISNGYKGLFELKDNSSVKKTVIDRNFEKINQIINEPEQSPGQIKSKGLISLTD